MKRRPFALTASPLLALIVWLSIAYTNDPRAFDDIGMGKIAGANLHLAIMSVLHITLFMLYRARLDDMQWDMFTAWILLAIPMGFLIGAKLGVPAVGGLFAIYLFLAPAYILFLSLKY